jgi:hypothetical protein
VNGLIAESAGGAWSYGGSILTFAFPMLLFIGVAIGLYVLYTKPEVVPGHRVPSVERPVSYTAIPGTPTATEAGGSPASAAGDPAADDGTKAAEGEDAEPEAQA